MNTWQESAKGRKSWFWLTDSGGMVHHDGDGRARAWVAGHFPSTVRKQSCRKGKTFPPVTHFLQKGSTSGRNCIIDWGPHIQTHEPVGGISNSIYKTCHQNSEIYETVCSYILLFSWKCWLMLISIKDTPRTNYKSIIVMLTSLSYIFLLTLIKDLNFF